LTCRNNQTGVKPLSAIGAKGFLHNTFKIELVKRLMVNSMHELAEKGAAIV
jgi:hypothetical protein